MKRRTVLTGGIAATLMSGCERNPSVPAKGSSIAAPASADLASVESCLRRIEAIDRNGPAIHAVLEVNPEAGEIARRLAGESSRGPLHGIPILIKDNIDTADAMQTTAGSLALVGSRPRQDAFLVEKLRKAGLVLLGKTNLSEWANIRSPRSTSGWSARGGLTRNPHKLAFNASGSSSGSAAAVAAGLARLAIGTETNGSIVSPASACGIVGFKPTVGLVSRRGIIPITHWQDTAGPMTRTVMDAALLLNAIAGVDDGDDATHEAPMSDFTALLSPDVLNGRRLGVVRSMSGTHPRVLELLETALRHLRSAGAVIVDPVELPHESELGRHSFPAMLVELRTDLNAYLEARGGAVRSLAEVIAFNEAHRDEELPHFGQEFFIQAEKLGTPEAIAMGAEARATARRLAGPAGIDAAVKEHRLDALICPTNDPIYRIDLAKGDGRGRVCSTPAAVAGYPHLTVPMGLVDDLPVGLSFFSTAWTDGLMLGLGHAFEQLMPAFREPQFISG
jgi:amidase